MKRGSKLTAVVAAAAALTMMLGACGSSSEAGSSSDANIITAYNSEPQNPLVPGNTNETGGAKPLQLLFSGLVSFDADGNASNEVADSITPNADATEYTITLKDGWKFTDGTPGDLRVLHQGLELRGQRRQRPAVLVLLLDHRGL